MNQKPIPLAVIDGETLMDARLPKRSFCIETLLPEGISMLGGAPKIGKSWMVLDIGITSYYPKGKFKLVEQNFFNTSYFLWQFLRRLHTLDLNFFITSFTYVKAVF